MEIEKKFVQEANAETNTTVDLFVDKSTKELKFLDRHKQQTTLAKAPTYKVVSGYVTQENIVLTEGPLVEGKSYYISAYAATDDFTNVGASANEAGITFIATGTTPTDWTNASTLVDVEASYPVLNIFENTLGTITPSWSNGLPYISSNELFTEGKTWKTPDVPKGNIYLNLKDSISNISINSADPDLILKGCSFEIRVYN